MQKSVRKLSKWYAELWAKYLAAGSKREASVIAEQAHRVWLEILERNRQAVAQ